MRAKRVTNVPRLNEELDQASLLRKYEPELRRLRAKLEERNRNVVDQRCLPSSKSAAVAPRRTSMEDAGAHISSLGDLRPPAVPGLTRATGRSGIKREK